jgi:hypothetical protein
MQNMCSDARRSAVPLAWLTMPATESPLRFSIVAYPHVAQLRLPARRLTIEPAVRVGRARMSIVAALLHVPCRAVVVAAVLGPEALVRGPGFDQRAVHRKVL